MKLTTELIFDYLVRRYDVSYTRSGNRNTAVGRPVFYDSNHALSNHICILASHDFNPDSLGEGVYISIGKLPFDIPVANIELLTLNEAVSPARLLNELQELFEFYEGWEAELNKLIMENAGYPAIIQCSAEYLDCAISIVDANFSVIAIASKDAENFRGSDNKVSDYIMSVYITDPHFSQGLQKDGVFEFSSGGDLFLSYNIKKDGRNLGRVTLLCDEKRSKDTYTYLLRFLASKINAILKVSGSLLVHNESLSLLREILSGYLSGKPMDSQYVSFKLKESGWSLQNEYILIRLQPEFRHEWQLHTTYLIPHIERLWPGACAAENDAYVAVLLNLDIYNAQGGKDYLQELAYFLRDGLLLAGLSRPFRGLDQLPSYYKQTELAVALGREIHPMYWYYRFDDYVLTYLLKFGTRDFLPEQICSRPLLYLIKYDRENNTEYYKTLRTYFNSKYSYTHASETLYIHRTTLIKRIEKIVELTKIDLDDLDENLYLELSFRYLDKVVMPDHNNTTAQNE